MGATVYSLWHNPRNLLTFTNKCTEELDCFSFVFSRNPIDRFISCWKMFTTMRNHLERCGPEGIYPVITEQMIRDPLYFLSFLEKIGDYTKEHAIALNKNDGEIFKNNFSASSTNGEEFEKLSGQVKEVDNACTILNFSINTNDTHVYSIINLDCLNEFFKTSFKPGHIVEISKIIKHLWSHLALIKSSIPFRHYYHPITKIHFYHVYKCGGTSMKNFISEIETSQFFHSLSLEEPNINNNNEDYTNDEQKILEDNKYKIVVPWFQNTNIYKLSKPGISNMQKDLKEHLNKNNLSYNTEMFHLNKTIKDKATLNYYNEELFIKIIERYKKDFEFFDYEIPNSLKEARKIYPELSKGMYHLSRTS